ncbi:hypothetical protein AbraIFM66950_012166 [Aspergillus brasiliensis]|nr:hypothetical protein AbraIFM66950_012166 [Aspergillus brasiliensis]
MHSRRGTRKACAFCHERKIKCDGAIPSCRNCLRAQTPCRPHERCRRFSGRPAALSPSQPPSDAPPGTVERLAWLESELLRVLNLDVRQVSTGTALDTLPHCQHLLLGQGAPHKTVDSVQNAVARPSIAPHEGDSSTELDPDIPLLAFNATGEARYLGASSGSIFARFIANTAQSILPQGPTEPCLHPRMDESSILHRAIVPFNSANWRTPATFAFLLRCYLKWVHSCYPLFLSQDIAVFESMCNSSRAPPEAGDLTILLYLVLSIGAIHAEQRHLLDHFQADIGLQEYQNDAKHHNITSEALYRKAIELLASEPSKLVPRISLIQILDLISIYASHRPSDNEQWHIAGMAMRIAIELGLHRHNHRWKFTAAEIELRRRVFWTTYVIEISLAFNLGRPNSISYEDADAPLPSNSEEGGATAMAIHHIKHRQIQDQMLSFVYRSSRSHDTSPISSDTNRSVSMVESLQQKLDDWHQQLHNLYNDQSSNHSPYPVEYWDRLYYSTSAVLSRPTPLIPQPGAKLQQRCFLSSCEVIEIQEKLIRNYRLPYSWMLLQGLVFSATSMIVTARTASIVLSKELGIDSFLDILTRCVRKFHIVLAVMRERWTSLAMRRLEDLLDRLCQDTLKHTINILVKQPSAHLEPRPENPPPPSALPFTGEGELAGPNGQLDYHLGPNEFGLPTTEGITGDRAYPGINTNDQFYPGSTSEITEQQDVGEEEGWRIFDTLFGTDELRFFFDVFPVDPFTM